MKNEGMKCPVCHKNLEVFARGKDIRFYSCPNCANGLDLKLYIQETTKLKAIRPLDMGSLIDLSAKNSTVPEIG